MPQLRLTGTGDFERRIEDYIQAMNDMDPFFEFMWDYDDGTNDRVGVCISFHLNGDRYRNGVVLRGATTLFDERSLEQAMWDAYSVLMDWAVYHITNICIPYRTRRVERLQ